MAEFEPDDPYVFADPNGLWRLQRVSRRRRSGAVAASWPPGGTGLPDGAPGPARTRTGRRPPMHFEPRERTGHRRLLNFSFGPERVSGLAGDVTSIARWLVAAMLTKGEADVVTEFSSPLAAHTLAALLGMDAEFGERLERAGLAWREARDAPTAAAVDAELFTYADEVVTVHRDLPRAAVPEILTVLGGVDAPAVADRIRRIFVTGHLAVAAAVGGAVADLAADPALQEALRGEPALIPAVTEELLRLPASDHRTVRTTARVTDAGHAVPVREQRLVAGAATGTGRRPSFGTGLCRSVAAELARLQLREGLTELLAATTAVRPRGGPGTAVGLH